MRIWEIFGLAPVVCCIASHCDTGHGVEYRSGYVQKRGGNRLLLRSEVEKGDIPAREGVYTRDQRLAELEAILFLASQPLSSRKLAQLAGLADGT